MALTKADSQVVTVTASDVGLGSVTNESKTTMFNDPIFTGTVGLPSAYEALPTLSTSGGSTNVDLTLGANTWVIYASAVGSNISAAFGASTPTSGKLINATFIIFQPSSGTARVVNAASIGGTSKTIFWAGGSAPIGTLGKVDVITLTIVHDSAGNQNILGSLVTYG